MKAFFASILKDIRMERSKVRDADNLRALFLSRFFLEFFMTLRVKEDAERKARVAAAETLRKEAEAKKAEAAAARERLWEEPEPEPEGGHDEPLLPVDEVATWGMSFSLVAEVLDEWPVRWVATRMKMTLENTVSYEGSDSWLTLKPPGWTELQASLDCFTQLVRDLHRTN